MGWFRKTHIVKQPINIDLEKIQQINKRQKELLDRYIRLADVMNRWLLEYREGIKILADIQLMYKKTIEDLIDKTNK